MHLKRLKLNNFRNLQAGYADFPSGVAIIIGENGAGKTNLLEAAQYACCGRSFRTSREHEMVREGSEFFRVEAELERNGNTLLRAVAFEPGQGARVASGGGPQWMPPGSVLCFSPDDLQLIKGAPASRRRFLDDAISRRIPSYRRILLDYQKVLSQRNSFLHRARAGIVQLSDISVWDRQLAALAVKIHSARGEHCRLLEPYFEKAYCEIAGEQAELGIVYISQLEGAGSEEEAERRLVLALAEGWSEDLDRLSTSIGTHRDDIEFTLSSRSLKPYGSQGEQRAAVLSLLLADRRQGGRLEEAPLLLLDDVMSELDQDRRRRLMAALSGERETSGRGTVQTIITAADAGLFTGEELDAAHVLEVDGGSIWGARAGHEAQA